MLDPSCGCRFSLGFRALATGGVSGVLVYPYTSLLPSSPGLGGLELIFPEAFLPCGVGLRLLISGRADLH